MKFIEKHWKSSESIAKIYHNISGQNAHVLEVLSNKPNDKSTVLVQKNSPLDDYLSTTEGIPPSVNTIFYQQANEIFQKYAVDQKESI